MLWNASLLFYSDLVMGRTVPQPDTDELFPDSTPAEHDHEMEISYKTVYSAIKTRKIGPPDYGVLKRVAEVGVSNHRPLVPNLISTLFEDPETSVTSKLLKPSGLSAIC